MKRNTLLLVAATLLLAIPATAQVSYEITPTLGYSFGTSFDEFGTDLDVIENVDVKDSETYGLIFNAGNPRSAFEFTWSHQSSEIDVNGAVDGVAIPHFDYESDNFMFGGVYYFGQNPNTRPFINGGLGFTSLQVGNSDSDEQFSWSIGGGIRHEINNRIGLRLQARWTPTYINSDDAYVVCDPFFCYTVADDNYLYQTEVSGGIVFKF